MLIFPLFLIFLLVGVLLWVFYQSHPFQIPLPEGRPGIKSVDFIFPIFMLTEVPHIFEGLPHCRDSVGGDVVDQLRDHVARVRLDDGFCETAHADAQRGLRATLQ